ncbi:hypothetical protein HN832_03655 [archaeon]|jgi:hypothetical protein|nr:hypothetical protein [archaeon]MBT4373508.1 hypothetical protein [archaeon]MBT4531956.1 hypothetical protein [archaeon]MBT7001623.1 hypothetical protein [archaeon]MBT7282485.1 hypothetical protein [archaeon]
MKKTLALVVAATLAITGCCPKVANKKELEKRLEASNDLIRGTILEENYVAPRIEKVGAKNIQGFVSQAYSNETLTLGKSIYNLKIKIDEGSLVVVNILDGVVPKESVNQMFVQGERVGFSKGNLWFYDNAWCSGCGKNHAVKVEGDPQETGFYQKGDQYVTRRPRHITRLEASQ